jgi:hypothetical protein
LPNGNRADHEIYFDFRFVGKTVLITAVARPTSAKAYSVRSGLKSMT